MKLVVVDYKIGNLLSVTSALKSQDFIFDIDVCGDKINASDLLILPGVASFGKGVHNLHEFNQFDAILEHYRAGKPVIGLCLGAQILLESSEESEGVSGLKLVSGTSIRMQSELGRVPFQGWRKIDFQGTELETMFSNQNYFYFSHSYMMKPSEEVNFATTISDEKVIAFFQKENLTAIQFHPEKSGNNGLKLLRHVVDLARLRS